MGTAGSIPAVPCRLKKKQQQYIMSEETKYDIDALMERASILRNNSVAAKDRFIVETGDALHDAVQALFGNPDCSLMKTLGMLRSVVFSNMYFAYTYQSALKKADNGLFAEWPDVYYDNGGRNILFSENLQFVFVAGGFICCKFAGASHDASVHVFGQVHRGRYGVDMELLHGGRDSCRSYVRYLLDHKIPKQVIANIGASMVPEDMNAFADRTCRAVKVMLDRIEAGASL